MKHPENMGKFGAAVLGCGRIGRMHCLNLLNLDDVYVFWLVDVKEMETSVKEFKDKLKIKNEPLFVGVEEFDKVLNDPSVDFVVICLPTVLHAEYIKQSLRADKHVFCEKPLALTQTDVEECYSLAEEKGKFLFTAYNRRFDPGISSLYQTICKKDLGKLRSVTVTSREYGSTMSYFDQNKGGIFLDMGIHEIDFINWLVDESPSSVVAFGSNNSCLADQMRTIGEYDIASALMLYPSGVTARFELARGICYGYDFKVELLLTDGNIVVDNLPSNTLKIRNKDGMNSAPLVSSWSDRFKESYEIELKHFVQVLNGKEPMMVTSLECINDMKVSAALGRSLITGKIEYP